MRIALVSGMGRGAELTAESVTKKRQMKRINVKFMAIGERLA